MTQINFEVKGKSFNKGYYTLENFNGIMTYWLVYPNSNKYTHRINNCRLMLKLFNQLPEGATVNAHNNKS
jgi:hypothetical protein